MRRHDKVDKKRETVSTIDDYIKSYPREVQLRLTAIRKLIAELAPQAVEKISYQMPAFSIKGNMVYFAAYARHIGFYPTPQGIGAFKKELSDFKNGKGSVQFPHDQPLPIDLIRKMVKYRIEKNPKKKRGNRQSAAGQGRKAAK
jgi:uncharacterized protein YdhG (YjbR/CyaY superfamily)